MPSDFQGPAKVLSSTFSFLGLQEQQHHVVQDEKTSANVSIPGKDSRLSSGCLEPVSATTSATTHVSDAATIAKLPVASPPMECDSSVPSPPKTSVTVSSNASCAPHITRHASPPRKEEDVRSERSFVDSPQPHRTPAPAPWDSTPSPRPRDYSPDRESTATRDTEKDRDYEKEKDQRDADKEKEEKETVKKKSAKEARGTVTSQPRPRTKANEIARLLDDLCEGSWANTVRRVSSTSRRPTDEAIIERNSKREKKKSEKRRKKERSRDQRASFASSSSVSSLVTPASSKAGRRRLKQLSDDSSSSESSSDSEQTPLTSRKTVSEKKKADSKKKPVGKSTSDISSNRSTDSDYDSDERAATKRGQKRRYLSNEKSIDKKKNSSNLSVAAKKKVKGVCRKRQDTNTEEDESVTQHDPQTTCALNGECTKPQSEQVGWIFCDDCQNWFHNICILGREDAPDDEFFYCGCKAKKKTKKR
ncbi:hypothetical protein RB195_019021 [Necator americanus]|uniref:PHD-type domain-containing protein n=2 Tax=Necator americanus TaxID=51031 RepID=A0ABR1CDA5_NECAM